MENNITKLVLFMFLRSPLIMITAKCFFSFLAFFKSYGMEKNITSSMFCVFKKSIDLDYCGTFSVF